MSARKVLIEMSLMTFVGIAVPMIVYLDMIVIFDMMSERSLTKASQLALLALTATLFALGAARLPQATGYLAAMATLAIVVNGLSDMEKILPAAQDLAARHVAYGVTPKHYQPVGEALLWTLEKGLEDAWTPAVAEAWATAYGTLSSVMVESAYPRSTSAAITAAE